MHCQIKIGQVQKGGYMVKIKDRRKFIQGILTMTIIVVILIFIIIGIINLFR